MANPTLEEVVLLKRLERQVASHFISPYLSEHLVAAHGTLVALRELRQREEYPQRGLSNGEIAQLLTEDLA